MYIHKMCAHICTEADSSNHSQIELINSNKKALNKRRRDYSTYEKKKRE